MFPCDILAEIFSHLSYQCLYNTIKVSKLWQKASQNQLIIRHQTNIILPVLHNKLIHDQFIQSLRDIFLNHIKRNSITFIKLLDHINKRYNQGYHDGLFLSIYNDRAYAKLIFDALYDHIMKKIKRVILYDAHNMYRLKSLPTIIKYYREQNLFEKAFVIFMYLRKILTNAYDDINIDIDDSYECIEWYTGIDHNRVFYYGLPSTGM